MEMVSLGRELLERYIANELTGKIVTGHFTKEAGQERRLDEDFNLDELTPEDFIMACKVLTRVVTTDDYQAYKMEHGREANKSQQILLTMINNKVTSVFYGRGEEE